jgi:hypothetical protein
MNTRNFTLRLTEEECTALDALRELTRKNTDSAVIKHIIMNFECFFKRFYDSERKNKDLTDQITEIKKDVSNYIFSQQRLRKYLP